jgi:tetratricopeptide (TPR) repeat protein
LIELEPDQATAYIHLARVAATRGDVNALDRLTQRALALAPEGDRGLEMRMFRAYLRNDARARERIRTDLRQAPEDLIGEVIWSAATFVRQPDAVLSVLSAAVESNRSAELQALAHSAMAFVEAGGGRWRAAQDALARVETLDPVMALHQGGFLAVARGLLGDTAMVREYRDRLLRVDWSRVPESANRAVWFSASDGAQPYFRWYLLGLSNAMLGGRSASYLDSLRTATRLPGTGSTFADQVRTLSAFRAMADGSNERALSFLEQNAYDVWHQIATASPFFNQGIERFLYAMVLEEAGRLEDAAVWYQSMFDTALHDRLFWAPAHLHLARIGESLGDNDGALRHYRQATMLWSDADPTVQGFVDEARQGIQRLTS